MQNRLVVRALVGGLLALTLGLAGNAHAAPQEGVEREGFIIGLSVGVGALHYPSGGSFICTYTYYDANCTQTDTEYSTKIGIGGGFHLGAMISKRVALIFDGTAVSTSSDGALVSAVDTAALQYWMNDKTWVKGGVGIGLVADEGASESGFGMMAAVGTELKQKGRYAMDLSARFATVGLESGRVTQLSVQLGFNWY
jgi:hypothetical protein